MFRIIKWMWGSSSENQTQQIQTVTMAPAAPLLSPSMREKREEASSTVAITKTLKLENPARIEPVEKDTLGYLQVELTALEHLFVEKTAYWKKKEIEILSTCTTVPSPPKTTSTYLGRTKKIAGQLFNELQSLIFSADWTLHVLFKTTQPHILTLCKDLNQACEKLSRFEGALTEEAIAQKNMLKLQICHLSVEILEALRVLINDVQREIIWCVQFEKLGESVAIAFAEFALNMLVRIPLPAFNFSINPFYREFLYHEIQSQKVQLEGLMMGAGGEVQKAQASIIKTDNANVESKRTLGSACLIEAYETNASKKPLALGYQS